MKIEYILKLTRSYKGLLSERIGDYLYRRYIRKKLYVGITWFNEEDIFIHYSSKDYIERSVWMKGEYESEVQAVFTQCVKKGDVALDIGANIGINTIRLAKLVGDNGKVFSFEPVPYIISRFQENIKLNAIENVSLIPVALGSEDEELRISFSENEENKGATSLRNRDEEGIMIKVRCGDKLLEENSISNVNFIKIDVEGFEWEVLQGLERTIEKYRPTLIVEWDIDYQNRADTDIDKWAKYIEMHSYELYQIKKYYLQKLSHITEAEDGNILLKHRNGE